MIILPGGAINPSYPRIGYDNVVMPGAITADEEADGYPASNLGNPATYLQWRGTTAGAQNVEFGIGTGNPVDYVGIAVHNLGSSGAVYSIDSSPDGATWTPRATALPTDDGAIIHAFASVTEPFWRIALAAGSLVPSMAVVYFGELLTTERRLYVGHRPISLARERDVSSGRSENGAFLGRVRRRLTLRFNIEMPNLTPLWVRESLDPFLEVCDVTPFFWSWRPNDYPSEVGYCWSGGDPVVVNQRPNGMMQFSMPVQAVP